MNPLTQAGSSNVTTFLPMKRRRGRPRKEPRLKHVDVSQAPPDYGVKENKSRQADIVDFSNGGMVGQPITGVIETAFDAGYVLNVRIGNSNASFRGFVFKPGHALPLTPLNDVAPLAQMIKRNEVPLPLENKAQGSNGTEINNGALQRLSSQPSDRVVSKGKQALRASSLTHMNGRGKVVPVVLQPATTALSASTSYDSSDKDVVAAEPLSVLLPFGSSSSNQFLSSKSEKPTPQVPPGSLQNAHDSCTEGTHENEDRGKTEKLTQADVPVNVLHGSSEPPYMHDGSKSGSFAATSKHLKNDGSGRMTDLLRAMQGNYRPFVDSNVE